MKVLHLYHSKRPQGGISIHVANIINEISSQSNNLEVDSLNLYSYRGFFILNKKIINPFRLLKRIEPYQIIHLHGIFSIVILFSLIASIFRKKVIVCTPHYHPVSTLNHPRLSRLWIKFIQRFVRRIHHFIVLTDLEKELLSKEVLKNTGSNISIIPNGCRFKEHSVLHNRNKFDLLFVGNTSENKNLKVLFRLEDFFIRKNLKLAIVIEKQMKDWGPFKFFSNLSNEELVGLYKDSKILIIPSKYEAFSLVAIEALNFNCKVIASSNVAISSLIKVKNNFFFIYDNPNELEELIESVLQSENDNLTFQEAQSFLKNLTWSEVSKKTVKVYEFEA